MRNIAKVGLTVAIGAALAALGCSKPANTPATSTTNESAASTSATAPSSSTAKHEGSGSKSSASGAPEVEKVTIPAGTSLSVRINQTLGSDSSTAGQSFQGQLAHPVAINGHIAIPAGASVAGTVVSAASSGHFKGRSELALRVSQISYNGQSYDLTSRSWSAVGPSRGKRTGILVGGGAGAGALIGALIGHGKGAAIGAASGAGAGAATQEFTKPKQIHVAAETVLSFRLSQPLTVTPASAVLK